jgi:hypothetical protein
MGDKNYPANDIIVVGKVSLATLAPVNAGAVKIGVVREAHGCHLGCTYAKAEVTGKKNAPRAGVLS